MEIKMFGKKVFEFISNKSGALVWNSTESLKQSEFLPDFYTMRANQSDFVVIPSEAGGAVAVPIKNKKPKQEKVKLTPKGIFELKLLDNTGFKINTNKEYVESQIQQFKDKLNLIKMAEYDMSRGTNEIASILIRMENRIKYDQFNSFFDNYAYTSTVKIDELVKKHDYLKIGKVEQFLADMPKEAVDEMKDYTANTKKLCNKKPIFYIIADKKDFEKSSQRRDPILLAQSPFGHFWQIIGAWDKEMMFLEEL